MLYAVAPVALTVCTAMKFQITFKGTLKSKSKLANIAKLEFCECKYTASSSRCLLTRKTPKVWKQVSPPHTLSQTTFCDIPNLEWGNLTGGTCLSMFLKYRLPYRPVNVRQICKKTSANHVPSKRNKPRQANITKQNVPCSTTGSSLHFSFNFIDMFRFAVQA